MKKTIILLLLAIVINTQAQVKILFDATKAETASNADWVIDADNWNLKYDPYPQLGGNEANAQRYPTPSQQNINASTSETYWSGGISAWGVELAKAGYTVETLPYDARITYGDNSNQQDLSNYQVFIVCEPNMLFSEQEKTAIISFVQNGGGLFMIADHDNSDRNGDGYDSPYIWNDLMQNNNVQNNPFGITFDYSSFTEQTSNIPYSADDPLLNGPYGSVSLVEFYAGTSITINPNDNPSVKGVVYRRGYSNSGNTGVMCAYATYGNGRVVALGDSSPTDDGTGDYNDNLYNGWTDDANGNHRKLIMNATIWLAQTSSYIKNDKLQKPIIRIQKNAFSILIPYKQDKNAILKIYDLNGKLIHSQNIQTGTFCTIQVPQKGIYLYKTTTNNDIYYDKIVIF